MVTGLNALVKYVDAITSERSLHESVENMKKNLIPPEIQVKLDEIDSEYAPIFAELDKRIKETKDNLNVVATSEDAETITFGNFKAVFNPGKYSVDMDGIFRYAIDHPEILKFINKGKPYYSVSESKTRTKQT